MSKTMVEDNDSSTMKILDIDDDTHSMTRTRDGVKYSVHFQWWKRPYKVAALCLGLLCVLLLAGIIGLGVHFTGQHYSPERDQLQTSYNNMTKERDQLQINYSTLTKERDPLQTSFSTLTKERDQLQTSYSTLTKERDQLQTSYSTLTKERDQLQTSYSTLTKDRDQLQRETIRLNKKLKGRPCHEGWIKFETSCYFLSTVNKTWEESRMDCIRREAHLVIINNREEQVFINGLNGANKQIWIGLTDTIVEGTWKWVDGTPLTTTYWGDGQPNSWKETEQDCGEFVHRSTDPGDWNDDGCSVEQYCVCEK
ncbi:CD209 antigen-like protein C isoform X1 [Oncorhynchus tshawytscha]|uniref:CD209 antigen-like protein C isoform X1 n=1 Tax=Oncorhynchus tshawytscha TaxID=74940 RepID=UPI001C3D9B5D|nr:CD209 antigen-like protein C isoform X1 [Oncorhynchus tshawytscha]